MQSKEELRQSMFDKVAQWQKSGLSQKAFCQEQNIKYYVFHYWYKQYRDEYQQVIPEPNGFIEIQSPAGSSDMFAELIMPGGKRVILHQPVSSDYLHTLLR